MTNVSDFPVGKTTAEALAALRTLLRGKSMSMINVIEPVRRDWRDFFVLDKSGVPQKPYRCLPTHMQE